MNIIDWSYILFFLLVLHTFFWIKQTKRKKKKCKIISEFFEHTTSTLKKIGPKSFILNYGLTKIYVYNPSIEIDDDGDIICISRITGRTTDYCRKTQRPTNFTYNKLINDEINRFPKKLRNEISSMIVFKIKDPSKFTVINNFKISSICSNRWTETPEAQGIEDPRLFKYNNDLWIYAHYRGNTIDFEVNGSCKHTPILFKLSEPDKIIKLNLDGMTKIDKNWMPFEYNNQLYFEYSISPHIILKCDINTGYCTKLYSTDYNGDKTLEFGCGSPPQKIKVDEIEYFLGLGHIRINRPEAIRKNFFYLFTSEPPFKIIKKGNLFNIVDKSKKIEFGSGMIIRDNKIIIISAGIEDCFGVIKEYDLEQILKSLNNVLLT